MIDRKSGHSDKLQTAASSFILGSQNTDMESMGACYYQDSQQFVLYHIKHGVSLFITCPYCYSGSQFTELTL